jgi:vacuolar-type H+-ATPase subunit F/Vma7
VDGQATSAVIFVGDEVAAAGWRLAGVQVRVCAADEATAALAAARSEAAFVLLSAALVPHLAPAVLGAALGARTPLLAVVPDVQGATALPALAARLRAQLGMEAA